MSLPIVKKIDDNNFCEFDIENCGKLLDWLRFAGSRAPVYIYSKWNFKNISLINLKNRYQNLTIIQSFDEYENFCCLKPLNLLQEQDYSYSNQSISETEDDSKISKSMELS